MASSAHIAVPVVDDRSVQRAAWAAATHRAPALSREARTRLLARIKRLLAEEDAVLVAHYYVDEDLQRLAEETGGYISDSLDMARFGNEHPASTLVVAGVRFMGETAKILNPEKRVLMPTLEAECSLDLNCPPDQFSQFCDEHPEYTVVVYANTSAAVKARADWMVTSGIAVPIVEHLARRGEKILWAPDRHLGAYIRKVAQADMLLWQGSCIVHDEFKASQLAKLKERHPEAAVLVHPEAPAGVIEIADVVGSTTALIKAASRAEAGTLIVATDRGIFYKMRQAAPDKTLIEAPTGGVSATCSSCAHCPWMAMNGLRNLAHVLETGGNEVQVDESIRRQAVRPVRRMLAFARGRNAHVLGAGDA